MRVLWLIKGLGPGGAERLLTLAARHRDPLISVHVVYLLPHKSALVSELRRTGVNVTCLGARRTVDARWLLRLRRVLRDERLDVVHVHSPVMALGARVALRTLPAARRPRVVTTEHNVWTSHARATRVADRLTAGLDDRHVAVSAAVRDSMPRRLRRRTEVLYHGIDVAAVEAQRGARDRMRRELGIAGGALVVGTVANLRWTKGYPDLLAAAVAVTARLPEVRFVTVGQGPQAAALEARRDELGLADRFAMLGWRDDAVAVMSAFDVFCLASLEEGLPIALVEAMTLGLPVVATTVGGVPEIVTHGREGLLVPPRRPDELAVALVRVLSDAGLRREMAAHAARRGRELGADRAVRRVEEIYRELLGAAR
jgi:glycosyltransferase involved in cell wall biosynthesis